MIYILYGEDSYRSREKLSEIIEAYRAKAKGVLDIEQFDAEDDDAAMLPKLGQSHSLFQKKKLIVVSYLSRGSESFLKRLKQAIQEWKDDENTIVVLWDDAEKKSAAKWLAVAEPAAKNAHEYKSMTPKEASKWLTLFLENQMLSLDQKAADELAAKFSQDTWRLANEAGKAAMGGEIADRVEIDDKKIFSFLDFLFLDRICTLQALVALRDAGVSEQYIFSAAVNHTRLLLILSDGKELGPEAGTHPFVLSKAQRKVRELDRSKIRALYERLFDEDVKIKTGASDPYSSIVNLVLTG